MKRSPGNKIWLFREDRNRQGLRENVNTITIHHFSLSRAEMQEARQIIYDPGEDESSNVLVIKSREARQAGLHPRARFPELMSEAYRSREDNDIVRRLSNYWVDDTRGSGISAEEQPTELGLAQLRELRYFLRRTGTPVSNDLHALDNTHLHGRPIFTCSDPDVIRIRGRMVEGFLEDVPRHQAMGLNYNSSGQLVRDPEPLIIDSIPGFNLDPEGEITLKGADVVLKERLEEKFPNFRERRRKRKVSING